MSYYDIGQKVLACVSVDKWAPGEVTGKQSGRGERPYEVTLDGPDEGKRVWYFNTRSVIEDNTRNRRNKGLPIECDSCEDEIKKGRIRIRCVRCGQRLCSYCFHHGLTHTRKLPDGVTSKKCR